MRPTFLNGRAFLAVSGLHIPSVLGMGLVHCLRGHYLPVSQDKTRHLDPPRLGLPPDTRKPRIRVLISFGYTLPKTTCLARHGDLMQISIVCVCVFTCVCARTLRLFILFLEALSRVSAPSPTHNTHNSHLTHTHMHTHTHTNTKVHSFRCLMHVFPQHASDSDTQPATCIMHTEVGNLTGRAGTRKHSNIPIYIYIYIKHN